MQSLSMKQDRNLTPELIELLLAAMVRSGLPFTFRACDGSPRQGRVAEFSGSTADFLSDESDSGMAKAFSLLEEHQDKRLPFITIKLTDETSAVDQ